MKQDDKSTNPNNPECSSVKQALLDLQSSGFDYSAIQTLLSEIEQEPDKRKQADELFRTHRYPLHSIVFSKIYNKTEFCRFLSPQAITILLIMCITMNHNNLIQISQDDIIRITGIGNKGTVSKALNDLLVHGAVAIKLKGNSRRSNVYMVNPAIATVGTDTPGLERVYWKIIDNEYEHANNHNGSDTKITPHDKWDLAVIESTYSVGCDRQKLKDSEYLYFNKINPPAKSKKPKKGKGIQQKKTSGVATTTPDASNSIDNIPDDEELPFYY